MKDSLMRLCLILMTVLAMVRKALHRSQVLPFFRKLAPCVVDTTITLPNRGSLEVQRCRNGQKQLLR